MTDSPCGVAQSPRVTLPRSHPQRLTGRQAVIIEHVADGRSNKEIAVELAISEQVVKEHVSALLQRLGVANRAALGAAAATRRFIGEFSIDPSWLPYLFRQAPIPIAVLAGPEHRFVAFNRRYGLSAEGRELLDRPYAEVFPAETATHELLVRAFTSGERLVGPDVLQPLPGSDGAPRGVAIFARELQARDEAQQPPTTTPSGSIVDRPTLMLVEDDADTLAVLARRLREHFRVFVARNEVQAIAVAEELGWNAAILVVDLRSDMRLRGDDFVTLYRQRGSRRTAMVIVSGPTHRDEIARTIRPEAILSRPVDPDELLRFVDMFVRRETGGGSV